MNTPAHLLLGSAAFGRDARLVWAAMVGALLPDLSLYVMAGVSMHVLGIAPNVVFDQLYFSDAWQTVFAIDNSFVVWGALLGITIWTGRAWAMALCGAALLHLALDFPLHHDDGRPHFWPLSGWVFESPVSYWDRSKGAEWIAPAELILAVIAAVALWRARLGLVASFAILVLLALEVWIVRTWLFVFGV